MHLKGDSFCFILFSAKLQFHLQDTGSVQVSDLFLADTADNLFKLAKQ